MPIHKDRKKKRCTLIDMAIPSDRNTSVKVTEELNKYKDLEIEINRMWITETESTPVVFRGLGLTRREWKKSINCIPGNINIYKFKKVALLGTAHNYA